MVFVPTRQIQAAAGQETRTGVVWRGLAVLADNINRRGVTLNRTRRLAIEKLASDMEAYAKENASWQDRTGDARALLKGDALHDEANDISIAYLSHGVPYGIWLEIMNSGEFAIVMPTVLEFQSRFMSAVVAADNFSDIIGQYQRGGD